MSCQMPNQQCFLQRCLNENLISRLHQANDCLRHQGQQICEVWEPEGAANASQCNSDQQQTLRHRWTHLKQPGCYRGLRLFRVLWPKDRHLDVTRHFAVQTIRPWISAISLRNQQTQPTMTHHPVRHFALTLLRVPFLPLAKTDWPLTTQMGNHFKLAAFLHAARSLPQLSSTVSQADFHWIKGELR